MVQITKSKSLTPKKFETLLFPNADELMLVLASVDSTGGQPYWCPSFTPV